MKQSGFTLIEMTIVLVIVSLLIGGVLKGQELMDNAKVKNLANDFKNVPVFIYGYQDKFKALPGDDRAATTHVAATANGDGDGLIDGNWNDPTGTPSEATYFWQNVRLGAFTTGATNLADATYMPSNAVGGMVGVQSGTSVLTNTPIRNATTAIGGAYVVCSSGISGRFARQLESMLDDGNSATGLMMAGAATAAGTPMTAVATLNDNDRYTVCMGV